MKKLAEMKQGQTGVVTAINGDARYMSRITSIGITPGCIISMLPASLSVRYLFVEKNRYRQSSRHRSEGFMGE